ncbi:tetratricopeptide repeat protein [Dongia sp.]|uniref:tetratricopeptide repeat protein n=1 Tax=Dongia sp. TaxID=1977262 RepID=UPI003752A954
MRALSVAALAVLAGWVAANPALAEDRPLGAGCDDAVARGVWDLAIDLCAPEMLPADASPQTKARILLGRAKAYRETGDPDRAAADAAEAQRLDPDSAAAFQATETQRATAKGALQQSLKAAQASWDRGDDAGALAALDRIIADNPNSAQAYALRASIYLARRDEGRAQGDIQSATRLARNCALTPKKQVYVFTCPE